VKTSIDNLFLEKQKMEKGDKPKKKGGAKGKGIKLKMEGEVRRCEI
jgi:translation initiation factor 3 subunit J